MLIEELDTGLYTVYQVREIPDMEYEDLLNSLLSSVNHQVKHNPDYTVMMDYDYDNKTITIKKFYRAGSCN
jgi:hypothetical protein